MNRFFLIYLYGFFTLLSVCFLIFLLITRETKAEIRPETVIIQEKTKIPYTPLGEFTISFYNLNRNRTSQGTEVRQGHTVACDISIIPANSYVYIEDFGVRQCVDTGLHIKNKRLDIYMNKSTKELLNMGLQKKKVYLIEE